MITSVRGFIRALTPSQATIKNSSSSSNVVSVVYGEPTTNSFMLESPSERVTARTPIWENKNKGKREVHDQAINPRGSPTVHSIIHHEASSIGDSLSFLSITSLMIVGQSNGFPTTTADESVFLSSAPDVKRDPPLHIPHSPQHRPGITNVGGIQHPPQTFITLRVDQFDLMFPISDGHSTNFLRVHSRC